MATQLPCALPCQTSLLGDITPPEIFKNRFHELCHSYSNYYRIYTDGSQSDDRVGAAVVHKNKTRCVRLPNTASIFRAELYALLLAMHCGSKKRANFGGL